MFTLQWLNFEIFLLYLLLEKVFLNNVKLDHLKNVFTYY